VSMYFYADNRRGPLERARQTTASDILIYTHASAKQ